MYPTGCSYADRPSAAPPGIGARQPRPLVPKVCHLLATGNNGGPEEAATAEGSGQLWTRLLAAALVGAGYWGKVARQHCISGLRWAGGPPWAAVGPAGIGGAG